MSGAMLLVLRLADKAPWIKFDWEGVCGVCGEKVGGKNTSRAAAPPDVRLVCGRCFPGEMRREAAAGRSVTVMPLASAQVAEIREELEKRAQVHAAARRN